MLRGKCALITGSTQKSLPGPIGGLILTAPLTYPSLSLMLAVLAVYFGLHILASYLGYLTGFKNKPI